MRIFTLTLLLTLFIGHSSSAQWLDNTNKFTDSVHMEVCDAADDQGHTTIIKGEDGGYFIIWVDYRNRATNYADIYAQKYDKDGKRLWAPDGVPVANSTVDERITWAQNLDYTKYSYAAPDGAGGLYVCWTTDFQSWSGVNVQHLHGDGSRVFGPAGTVVGASDQSADITCFNPQMVTDSRGGFFIAYQRGNYGGGGAVSVYAYCYKDEGGILRLYGGGLMNEAGAQLTTGSQCGIQYYVDQTVHASIRNFTLYPDQQGGCNIVMAASVQSQQMYVAYNRLTRVKKDCHTTSLRRAGGTPDATTTIEADYKKDDVVRLYNYKTYTYDISCSDAQGNVYEVSNTKIENNGLGYLPLNADPKYDLDNPQGVILQTGGNINAELISSNERALDGSGGVTNYHLHGYYRLNEIYDSIPYELCSDLDHPYQAYRPTLPDNAIPTDTLLAGPDTLLARGIGYDQQNYTLTGSGNKVWASTRGKAVVGDFYGMYLQELKLVSAGTKKYTFATNTADKQGIKIGQEFLTSSTGTEIYYNTPSIATDSNANALFYVTEASRYVRVSPITDGGVLSWGSMGRPLGSAYWGGFSQNVENPYAVLSASGKAVVAWDNNRHTATSGTGQNIWIERVSDVFTPAYEPPLHTLQQLGTTTNETFPNYLTGTTNSWTTISQAVWDGSGYGGATPVVSILDNYPLGTVHVKIYENSGATRSTNGLPYLDRNISIVVDNNPHGSGHIPIRFYIPQAEFDALKAADQRISNPGDLGIIKQPNDDPAVLPATYTIVTGEQNVPLTDWGTVDGGYYIQFVATGFSNFFIAKGIVPLPLNWIDVQGAFTAPAVAAINWTVDAEKNVSRYIVQYSPDRVNFVDGCTTGSGNSGSLATYSCTVALPAAGTYFLRVRQEDIDGRFSYSKTIVLTSSAASDVFTVSPNPASSSAVLWIPGGAMVKKLTLLSVNGKAVWQRAGTASGNVTIPLTQLPAGVYYLQVAGDSDVHVLKIIKT